MYIGISYTILFTITILSKILEKSSHIRVTYALCTYMDVCENIIYIILSNSMVDKKCLIVFYLEKFVSSLLIKYY